MLVEKGQFCMGPITVAGCNGRCPSYGQPCRGCRGPVEEANIASEAKMLKEKGFTWADIQNRLRTFAASANSFDPESIEEGTNAQVDNYR